MRHQIKAKVHGLAALRSSGAFPPLTAGNRKEFVDDSRCALCSLFV